MLVSETIDFDLYIANKLLQVSLFAEAMVCSSPLPVQTFAHSSQVALRLHSCQEMQDSFGLVIFEVSIYSHVSLTVSSVLYGRRLGGIRGRCPRIP